MRRWFVALCLLGFASQLGFASRTNAQEFDLPTLRGSSPFIPASPKYARWAGFYAGGQIGQSSTETNFAGATQDLIAYLLRTTALENQQHPSEWGVLGKVSTAGKSYGIFVGYNVQWSDVILGLDFHYNRSSFFANAPVSPITRATSAGSNTYIVTVDGAASMRITDYGAARFRAGWIVNNFLPYGTLGFAVGRADITRFANVFGAENPPAGYPGVPCAAAPTCTEFNFTTSESKNAHFIYGWSAGAGVDVMLMPNFFVRAEVEYMSFTKAQGIQAEIGTARVGAGVKF